MKKGLVKFLCSLFAAVFVLALFPVSALEFEGAPTIDSGSALVCNLDTGDILFSKNADTRINPAAFTKMMTALLAFEYRQANGNVTVTVTEEMLSSAGGTTMNLKVGEVLPLDSLLSGLVVQNANDAALVLASVAGGNISAFVEQMNERAAALGMTNSYFSNPTGVDSAVMYTTLEDVCLLGKALYRMNDFMVLSETPKVSIPATNLTKERVYTNKNALVPYSYVTDYYTEDVRGMVAGFTASAGYCVATVRESKSGKNLVIISGGSDRSEAQNGTDISSYRDAKALLEWAESHYSVRKIIEEKEIICEKKVRLAADVDHIILVTGEELELLFPVDADIETAVEKKIRCEKDSFSAPLIEGEKCGELDIIYEGKVVGTVPLVAQTNVRLSRWLVMWDAVVGFFSQGTGLAVFILVIAVIVLYFLWLVLSVWRQYAKENREKRQLTQSVYKQEKERMKLVRAEERKSTQATMRKVRHALRTGYQVLQGDMDSPESEKPRRKAPPPSRAVAKVPEKYQRRNQPTPPPKSPSKKGNPRQENRPPQNAARTGERYRTGRPSNLRRNPPQNREMGKGDVRRK